MRYHRYSTRRCVWFHYSKHSGLPKHYEQAVCSGHYVNTQSHHWWNPITFHFMCLFLIHSFLSFLCLSPARPNYIWEGPSVVKRLTVPWRWYKHQSDQCGDVALTVSKHLCSEPINGSQEGSWKFLDNSLPDLQILSKNTFLSFGRRPTVKLELWAAGLSPVLSSSTLICQWGGFVF